MNLPTVPEIDVRELANMLDSNDPFILLDVREAMELDYAMIENSRLKVVPMNRKAQLGVEVFPEEVQQKESKILVM